MTCDQVAGNIVVAGFGDGGLRVYDRRLAPRDNMVRRYTGVHSSWVQNVHMQRGGNRELVTAEYAEQFLYPPSSRCSVTDSQNISAVSEVRCACGIFDSRNRSTRCKRTRAV